MPIVYESASKGSGGSVTSVTAADTSIVVAGTAAAPTVATGTLDVIAADHPPAADWSNNSHKITGLANGTAAADAAAFGQITGADGWINDTAETWTYASGSGGGVATFTVSGDVTAKYTIGTRVKLTQTTVKYFVVSAAPSFSSGTTTVTIYAGTDYTLANAAITANYHSYAANPQGYPGWFNFNAAASGFSSLIVTYARFSVVGNACTIAIRQTGTSNATTFNLTAPLSFADIGVTNVNYSCIANVTNNGAGLTPSVATFTSATNIRVDKTSGSADGWTSSGTKSASFEMIYPA